MLRIAVQSKGRLFEDTMNLLAEADIKVSASKRTLLVQSTNFPLEVLYLRDDDIPQSVASGVADIGVVGENEFVERGEDAEIISRLGFSKCRLSLAIPKEIDYRGVNWFNGKKIATSYPNILRNYMREQGIDCEIHVITGSVEISPGIGLADGIFDIVSSGSTLVSNNLREVEVVMQSEALLIGNKKMSAGKRATLDEMLFRFKAVKDAEDKKYVRMNAPKARLQEIINVLPGLKSPTIIPLADEEWCSVHTVLDQKRFWEIIGKLKEMGAQGILVTPIEKMILYRNPKREVWPEIIARPRLNLTQLNDTVATVLADIKARGDEAVREYELKFDKAALTSLAVSEQEMDEAEQLVSNELRDAIILAHHNIKVFHISQRFVGQKVKTQEGVVCWQKSVAIERVGLYIPGGTAPLFSTVLMLATPAKIAGCKEIVLCTPPNSEGKVNPAILMAARIAGVSKIYKIGGVQAIGAMAYGTETVPKVYKIFGPGNQYVMAAKQQVSLDEVAIDMPAGPSEVCVLADDTANAEFVAADLLSQAEHGIDSQVLFITTSEAKLNEVQKEVERQLQQLPRKEIAAKALDNSRYVLVDSVDEMMALSNAYAPEHLILQVKDYEQLAERVVNAGSVFLGAYACESAGDYASGTNHTLPTHGYATAYNGVNLDSYCRKITFQHLTEDGIRHIGRAVELMAEAEQLDAHKNAMSVRIRAINK